MEEVKLNYLQGGMWELGKRKVGSEVAQEAETIIRLTEMNFMIAGGAGRELRGCWMPGVGESF